MLLEKLYDDRIEWKYGETDFSSLRKKAISKRQYLPILLFGLMPKLSSELQGQIISFMIDCVNVDVADLSHLETITVGDNAFCFGPDLYPYMPQCSQQIRERSATLSIRSCPLLCSVNIGAGSFSSFSRLALCGLDSLPS